MIPKKAVAKTGWPVWRTIGIRLRLISPRTAAGSAVRIAYSSITPRMSAVRSPARTPWPITSQMRTPQRDSEI